MIGFAGIILIMGVGKDIFSIYALLPITAAFGYAISSVTVKLFPEELSTAQIQFGTQVITLIAAIFFMLASGGFSPIYSFVDLLLIALMGTSGGLGVICLISAYRTLEPSILAPFEYFGIPLSIILGWIFFSEFPLSQLFPGVIFILVAGALIIWRENRTSN
jgi:drug/metabolite transporter (DMT)-like permease